MSHITSRQRIIYKPSITCWISFLEVALSITVSRTDIWPEADVEFAEAAEPSVEAALGSLLEVCCKMEILVWIGIPGINFSATAFRIAARTELASKLLKKIPLQHGPANTRGSLVCELT
jgi:hypothetical protein